MIKKLAHEEVILKRHKFVHRNEQLSTIQGCLLDELIDSHLATVEAKLAKVMSDEEKAAKSKQQPKRGSLPPEPVRTPIHRPDQPSPAQAYW